MSDQQILHKLKHKEEENIYWVGQNVHSGFQNPNKSPRYLPRELETHVHTNTSPTSIQNHSKWFLVCEWKNRVCVPCSAGEGDWTIHYGNNTDNSPIYLPVKAARLWRSQVYDSNFVTFWKWPRDGKWSVTASDWVGPCLSAQREPKGTLWTAQITLPHGCGGRYLDWSICQTQRIRHHGQWSLL